jgi:hypothetical protein
MKWLYMLFLVACVLVAAFGSQSSPGDVFGTCGTYYTEPFAD